MVVDADKVVDGVMNVMMEIVGSARRPKTKLTLNDQIDQIYHLLLIVKKYFSISELFRHAKNHLVSFQMIWDSGRSHPQFQHNSHIFPRP